MELGRCEERRVDVLNWGRREAVARGAVRALLVDRCRGKRERKRRYGEKWGGGKSRAEISVKCRGPSRDRSGRIPNERERRNAKPSVGWVVVEGGECQRPQPETERGETYSVRVAGRARARKDMVRSEDVVVVRRTEDCT